MTTLLAATLARRAQVGQLVLFRLSGRYIREDWIEMLREARGVFPERYFPSQCGSEVGACHGAGDRMATKEISQ
jgi:ribonuclease BN (tRNA processing enzyme)